MMGDRGHIVLVLGGARSGKSRFAQELVLRKEAATSLAVTYVATAKIGDSEMERRVSRHRAARPARWNTLEAHEKIGIALDSLDSGTIILLDCITMMITNRMLSLRSDWEEMSFSEEKEVESIILAEVEEAMEIIRKKSIFGVLVSNEVGTGLVPPYPMGRFFRDLSGWVNQRVAAEADEAFFLIAGISQRLKGVAE